MCRFVSRFVRGSILVIVLQAVLSVCAVVQAVTFDTTGEQYRDIQENVVNGVINSQPGEFYDAISGVMRYYATDFYITGNGDLPIYLERTLDHDEDADHEFGHMKLMYSRLEFEGNLFYPWSEAISCNRDYQCQLYDDSTAINRVPNACVTLEHKYDYAVNTIPETNGGFYWGVVFPAPKFYVGDGKYIRFYLKDPTDTRFPTNANLVSQNNWYIDCVDSSTMLVHAPSGVVYEIKRQILTGSYFDSWTMGMVELGPENDYYTSSITDKHGNYFAFNYDKPLDANVHLNLPDNPPDFGMPAWEAYEKPKLIRIAASDGRDLSITYSGKRISEIADNSTPPRTLSYHYQHQPANNTDDLVRVTRSDGREWSYVYDYRAIWSDGWTFKYRVELRNFTTPEGLAVNYTYNMRVSCEFSDAYGCNSDTERVPALTVRTLSGPSVPAGTTYSFSYRQSGNRAITTVNTPSTKHEVEFGRLNYYDRPADLPHESGKLTRHTVFASDGTSVARETTWVWDKLYDVVDLSWFNTYWTDFRSPWGETGGGGRPSTYFFAGRRVSTQTITQTEGSVFQRTKSNFDSYGFPQSLVESSTLANGGGSHSRTTAISYYHDPAEWIIGNRQNETIQGEGTIARDYYAHGKLRYEDRFGVRADYAYHPDGELAERSWVKDGVTQTYRFQDYYRGTPRLEIDALGNPMSRTVADFGKVLTETDFNGATTTYQYDGLYRLSRIISPEPGYEDTVINWSVDGLVQTTTRGSYRKVVTHDALMRPILTVESDITRPGEAVTRSTQYDGAGRLRFESLPRAEGQDLLTGYEYAYDTLDRVVSKRFLPDNRTVYTCYGPACNTIAPYSRMGGVTFGAITQDERGYLTTKNFRAYGSPLQSSVVTILQETETSPHKHITTTIDRNLLDQITQVDQGGYTRRYIHDARKLLERVEQPEIGATVYGYDEVGNRISRAVGTEPATLYGYDGNNRLIAVDYPATTPDVAYTYDNNGNTTTSGITIRKQEDTSPPIRLGLRVVSIRTPTSRIGPRYLPIRSVSRPCSARSRFMLSVRSGGQLATSMDRCSITNTLAW